jgi:hypothetical protein
MSVFSGQCASNYDLLRQRGRLVELLQFDMLRHGVDLLALGL